MDTLENIHDTLKGKTVLIIANGPSLNDIPLTLLKKYPSFGTNKIFLLENFTSTYYVVTNTLVIDQNRLDILNYPAKLKFSKDDSLPFIRYNLTTRTRFSTNPNEGLCEGYTVTHICLQLAYWMGAATVLLVGLDHKYSDTGTPNKKNKKQTPDADHFSKAYFPQGTIWQYPDLKNSEISYSAALKAFTKDNRKIINISSKTACDIFPKDNWKNYA